MIHETAQVASFIISGLPHFKGMMYAYIDPGAGSAVIQVIIASLVGGLFGLKVLWQKLKSKVTKSKQ